MQQSSYILYKLGHYREALPYFDKALAIDPESDTYDNRGSDFYKLGEYNQALSSFNKAIEANQYDDKAYYGKALTLEKIGLQTHDISAIQMAVQTLDKTLSIYSDNKDAQNLKSSLENILAWNRGQEN